MRVERGDQYELVRSANLTPAGELVVLVELTFGRARLYVGEPGSGMYRDGW